jgi:hypothetical protein
MNKEEMGAEGCGSICVQPDLKRYGPQSLVTKVPPFGPRQGQSRALQVASLISQRMILRNSFLYRDGHRGLGLVLIIHFGEFSLARA